MVGLFASEAPARCVLRWPSPRASIRSPDGYTQGYLYLKHRPAEKVSNELNLVAGFAVRADQPATLSVGGKSFDLFTQKDGRLAARRNAERQSRPAPCAPGTASFVAGTSDKGINVTETFLVSGATAASRAIDSGC